MSEKSITAYLMETFSPEITEKICRELNLKEVNDILDVRDSQIESLHVLAPLKKIFKRIRDKLIHDAKVSGWLERLRENV